MPFFTLRKALLEWFSTVAQHFMKHHITSMVSSIYDPLGFLSLTLPAKLLLQDLCRNKCSWDHEVPQAASEKWRKWLTGLDKLENFRVARCVKPDGIGMSTQAELHHFSDASDHAYGTVSYLRLTEGKHTVHVAFMLGKARVAPLKQTTIPRLELVAAVLAVRVDRMLRKELDITRIERVNSKVLILNII